MAIDWKADFAAYTQGFKNGIYGHLCFFVVWMAIHTGTHFFLTNSQVLKSAVQTLREKDEAKGKVKEEAKYIKHAKSDISNKVTALLHAIVSSYFAINALMDPRNPSITYEDVYTLEPFYNFGNIVSSGYFIYDFVFAIYEGSFAFFIHGTFSYAIFGHSAFAFMNHVGGNYLIYEISTIFLNIRSLMLATGNTKNKLFNPIQLVFFATFMVVRMGWGTWYSLFHMQPFLYKLGTGQLGKEPHSYIALIVFSLCNASLQSLNIMWSGMMIKTIKQQLGGKKADKKAVKKQE